MKKQTKPVKNDLKINKASFLDWKKRREMISKAIPLEVDLENREIFFTTDIKEKLHFDFSTNNIDNLIKTYIDPKDSENVMESLTEAKKGMEKPIPFSFIHPITAKSFKFEYRYQIIYVKYSSTRLQGELVKMTESRDKNASSPPEKAK